MVIQTYGKNRETEMDQISNSLDTNWRTSEARIKQRVLGAFLEGRKEQELSTKLRERKEQPEGRRKAVKKAIVSVIVSLS